MDKPIRLLHKTQRGGEITYQGPLAPPGETVALSVDENGVFEAPPALAEELQRLFPDDVAPAPDQPKRNIRKERES